MVQVVASAVDGPSKLRWDLTVVRPDSAADVSFGELGEADLVAACLGGQTGAFDVIVERHRRTVYQLCYRFVGNHEDASDLSQDVFLRAYRGLRHFRGQSSIATWLYRIGVNVCLNRVSVKVPPSETIEAKPSSPVLTPHWTNPFFFTSSSVVADAAPATKQRIAAAVAIVKNLVFMSSAFLLP